MYILVSGKNIEDELWKEHQETYLGDVARDKDSGGISGQISNLSTLSPQDEELWRKLLIETYNKLQDADRLQSENIHRLQNEFEVTVKHLENEFGAKIKVSNEKGVQITFRPRFNETKKHSDNVGKQIREAIKQIKSDGLPDLADHLSECIKKYNRYQPPPDYPKWDVKM